MHNNRKDMASNNKKDQSSFEQKDRSLESKVVLITEDDKLNRHMLKRMITALGYPVDTAVNGKQVLEKLKNRVYSLILMDIHMPDMDGITTTKIIRKNFGLDIPIIGLTGDVFQETKNRCLEAGMNYFLSKPFKMTELNSLLKKYIR